MLIKLIYGYIKFSIKGGERMNIRDDLGKNYYSPKKLQLPKHCYFKKL